MDTAEQPFLLVAVDAPAKIGPVLEVLSRAGYSARLAQHADVETLATASAQSAGNSPDDAQDNAQSLAAVERKHFIFILKRTHGVIEGPHGAAVLLKLKPSTTRFRMKKLGITKADYLVNADAAHS